MALLLAAVAASFWGLSSVLVSKGSADLSVARGTALSLGVSCAVVACLAFITGEPWRLSTQALVFDGAIGVINFPLTRFFLYQAIAGLGAPRASVLRGAAPLVTLLAAVAAGMPVGGAFVAVGSVLVVAAVSVLFASDLKPSALTRAENRGLVFGALAMVGFGVLPLLIRLSSAHTASPLWESAWALFVGFVISAAYAAVSEPLPGPSAHKALLTGVAWFGISGLATGIAQSCNWLALHQGIATEVAAITAGSPVITAICWPLFGGKLNRRVAAAVVLVSLGAALVALHQSGVGG